jgi:hypothetical protein
MFSVYQKIVTPETSPVLGPIHPNNPTTTPATTVNASESFLLCNYCCSHRSDKGDTSKSDTTIIKNDEQTDACIPESKYPFGHATHYTYRVTTPRILCAFETGTPPSP